MSSAREVRGVHGGEPRAERAGVAQHRDRRATEGRLDLARSRPAAPRRGRAAARRRSPRRPARRRPGRRRAASGCAAPRRAAARERQRLVTRQPASSTSLMNGSLRRARSDGRPGVVAPAVPVERVEQGQPDAGVARRGDHGIRHHGRRVAVQVVELADRRVPGEQQLGVERGGERVIGVGIERRGHRVHLLAPGPEVAALRVGAAAQRAVERVRVPVRDAGQGEAGQDGVARLRRPVDDRRDRRPPSSSTRTPARTDAVDERVLEPEASSRGHPPHDRGRARRPPPRRPTPRRAPRASARRPVGLRTNSIAVGTPASESTPASCPAPDGSSGTSPPIAAATSAVRAASKGVMSVQLSSAAATPSRRSTCATSSRTRCGSSPRASTQRDADEAIAFTAPGSTRTRPTVARIPSSAAARRTSTIPSAIASTGSTRSASAVVPAWSATPARSIRQRPCGQISRATPTGRPAPASPRAPLGQRHPCPARCAARRTRRSWPGAPGRLRRAPGSCPAAAIASARVTPSSSTRASARAGVDRSGQQPGSQAGQPEAPALLLGEGDDRDGPGRHPSRGPKRLDRGERRDDAERPVPVAAAAHAVEVRAHDERRARAARRPTTPRGCRCRRSRRRAREPRPAPRTTRAARARSPPTRSASRRPRDRGRRPRARSSRHVSPCSRIGTRTPRSSRRADRLVVARRRRGGSRPSPGRCAARARSSRRPAPCRRRP